MSTFYTKIVPFRDAKTRQEMHWWKLVYFSYILLIHFQIIPVRCAMENESSKAGFKGNLSRWGKFSPSIVSGDEYELFFRMHWLAAGIEGS